MMIREWRLKRGLSFRAVAELVGVANGTVVRRWETGDCIPRRDEMRRIFVATAGKVTPNDFYDLTELAA